MLDACSIRTCLFSADTPDIAQIRKHCTGEDITFRVKQRQDLLHWA